MLHQNKNRQKLESALMRHKKVILIISLSIVVLIALGSIHHFFFSMNGLPHGEFLSKSISPQATYQVKVYLVSAAMSPDAIRCEVVTNDTKKTQNIYWGYREDSAEISWENDNIVIINGKKMDVRKDTYDWRK